MRDWLDSTIELAIKHKEARKSWLDGYSPVFIYGTGTFAQDVRGVLVNNGIPVIGFIDHLEREVPFLSGVPVYTPEIAPQASNPSETIVILGIHNYQANISNITDRLMSVGFRKMLTSVDLYDLFGNELGVRYWLTSRDFYFQMKPLLEEMDSLLSDEKSRSLLMSILEFRLIGDATKLPAPDLTNPYHPLDLPSWKTPLHFVDCGAFDGDTLADFIRIKIPIHSVAAFEPDLVNYAKLARFVKSQKTNLANASLFPCGVYSSTIQLAFETGRNMASNITGKGTSVIQCVALDDAIPTFAPNLIKMDIEGAEYDALLGARQIISTHTPGLAVSLYHRPEHLWQLPMLVENMVPGKYRFHMRSHALNDFELVLYAIPTG